MDNLVLKNGDFPASHVSLLEGIYREPKTAEPPAGGDANWRFCEAFLLGNNIQNMFLVTKISENLLKKNQSPQKYKNNLGDSKTK